MANILQVTDKFKLAKAMEALDALVDMVGKDHSIRKTEAWVVANHHLAVLKGVETMPPFWAPDHPDHPKAE